MIIERRQFLSLLAAPAIVSAANIMPVRTVSWLVEPEKGLRLADLGVYDGLMYRSADGRTYSISTIGLLSVCIKNGVVSQSYKTAAAVYEHYGWPYPSDIRCGFKQVGVLHDADEKQWSYGLHERLAHHRFG